MMRLFNHCCLNTGSLIAKIVAITLATLLRAKPFKP